MIVYVDGDICKGCGLCINKCPMGVFEMNDKVNNKGFNIVEAVNEDKCIKCRLCEKSCPDLAIFIDLEGKSDK